MFDSTQSRPASLALAPYSRHLVRTILNKLSGYMRYVFDLHIPGGTSAWSISAVSYPTPPHYAQQLSCGSQLQYVHYLTEN
jgi:hypothetical protein